MNSPRVTTHEGLTLNLSTIKCFNIPSYHLSEGTNTFVVEYKTRFDYIQHPQTGAYEKQEYNEITSIDFPTFEEATIYRDEWRAIWQDYLDDQG